MAQKYQKTYALPLLVILLIVFILTGLPSSAFSKEPEDAIGTFTMADIHHNYKTFILKPEYLEQKISTSYLPKIFSGTMAKSIISFDFINKADVQKQNPISSKVTFILNGGADHASPENTISNGTSYITYIGTPYKLGEKNTFTVENLLQAQNEGAQKIGAPILTRDQIGIIKVNFHIWYNESGDISVTHSGWDNYLDLEAIERYSHPPTLSTFFMVWIIIILFSILFCLAGNALLQDTWSQQKEFPVALKVGLSFFLGAPLFLVLYKFLGGILSNAQVAFFISLFLMALLATFGIKRALKNNIFPVKLFSATTIFSAITLLLILNIFVVLHWTLIFTFPSILPSGSVAAHIHQFVGTLHSGFYTNIATYVYESNIMPILGMNHSQSLLTSAVMFLGFNNPFLALNIWLSVSIFFLALLGYGLFRYFSFRVYPAIIGAFILLCGNHSLSLSHVLTIDSGSPWILCGYTDTILSFATLFPFLYVANETYKNNISLVKSLAVAGVIGASWNWFGPQNMVLLAPFAALLLFLILRKKITPPKSTNMIRFGSAYALLAVIGLTQGGMLYPHKYLDHNIKIPGAHAMNTNTVFTQYSADGIYLPHYYRSHKSQYWTPGMVGKGFKPAVANAIFVFETRLWTALRAAFFPVLGLLVLGGLIYRHRKRIDSAPDDSEIKWDELSYFWWVASTTFLGGFFIAYFFIVGSMKWELSRFMILGYNLGLIAFILSVHQCMKSIPSIRKNNLIWSCLALFMTFGPFFMTSFHIAANFFKDPTTAFERFRAVVLSSGMVG